MQFIVALLGLASAVAAVPTNKKLHAVRQNANFDDITALPAAALPVGDYKSLFFEGFNVAVTPSETGVQLAGVLPQSPPNVAAADLVSGLLNGPPALVARHTPNSAKFFDFNSFYFGCDLPEANSLTATPTACQVKVKGFRNGKVVATQTFKFVPSGLLSDEMEFARLNKRFSSLTKATFEVTGQLPPAFIVDSMKYVAYK